MCIYVYTHIYTHTYVNLSLSLSPYIYIYIYIHIHMYISLYTICIYTLYIYTYIIRTYIISNPSLAAAVRYTIQDSSKRGAVETGCSNLYDTIYYLLCNTAPIHCTPLRLHPPLMKTQYVTRSSKEPFPFDSVRVLFGWLFACFLACLFVCLSGLPARIDRRPCSGAYEPVAVREKNMCIYMYVYIYI